MPVVIHILPNISKIKINQGKKVSQLIECDSRNIFLGRSCTKLGGEGSARPLSGKLKLGTFPEQ